MFAVSGSSHLQCATLGREFNDSYPAIGDPFEYICAPGSLRRPAPRAAASCDPAYAPIAANDSSSLPIASSTSAAVTINGGEMRSALP